MKWYTLHRMLSVNRCVHLGLGQQQVCLGTSLFFFSSVCVRSRICSLVHSHPQLIFAAGLAPKFLRRYVAGGVSIALEKSKTAVRPLACGDPIRRLVAKCFCVAGKEEISKAFAGRNYGVGCPGGVGDID